MSDTEAWGELADMYLAQGDYKHAAFCTEELMLANPRNHLVHERFAEVWYWSFSLMRNCITLTGSI